MSDKKYDEQDLLNQMKPVFVKYSAQITEVLAADMNRIVEGSPDKAILEADGMVLALLHTAAMISASTGANPLAGVTWFNQFHQMYEREAKATSVKCKDSLCDCQENEDSLASLLNTRKTDNKVN
jgi:hypothetical protein